MTLRALIKRYSDAYFHSKFVFDRTLRTQKVPEALINAISQEATLTLRFLKKLEHADERISEGFLREKAKTILQCRLAYINNTYSATVESPMNTLCSLLGQQLEFNFRPQVENALNPEASASKLMTNLPNYSFNLQLGTLSLITTHEKYELICQSIKMHNPLTIQYILKMEPNSELLNRARISLVKQNAIDELNFLNAQVVTIINSGDVPFVDTPDLYFSFRERCLSINLDLNNPPMILSYYVHSVHEHLLSKYLLTPKQIQKIIALNEAVAHQNLTESLEALHLPEHADSVLTDAIPECIRRMPDFVKKMIDELDDEDSLDCLSSDEEENLTTRMAQLTV